MTRLRAAVLAGLLLAAPGTWTRADDERTETGPNGDFSITFPASWQATSSSWGESGQLSLLAEVPYTIAIVVSSRPLDGDERRLDRRQLLDRMIEQTMVQTVELGNEIVEVGRVESIHEDWPAFATVATDPDRSKIMTNLRSFGGDRAYTVTTLTDNLQGSTELGALVTRVVRSLVIHPPAPNPEE